MLMFIIIDENNDFVYNYKHYEDDKFEFEKEAHKENRSLNNFIVNAVKVYIRQKSRGSK